MVPEAELEPLCSLPPEPDRKSREHAATFLAKTPLHFCREHKAEMSSSASHIKELLVELLTFGKSASFLGLSNSLTHMLWLLFIRALYSDHSSITGIVFILLTSQKMWFVMFPLIRLILIWIWILVVFSVVRMLVRGGSMGDIHVEFNCKYFEISNNPIHFLF